jgi:3-hydroxyisobutyrate dehydrogenase
MLKAGHVVRGFDIDAANAKRAGEAGIVVVDGIKAAVEGADAVFTMLPNGAVVEQVYTSRNGVFKNIAPNTIVVDSSTIGVAFARKIHEAASKANVAFVEAPVSGGVTGAAAGSLTFMLGGSTQYVERVTKLLQPMGRLITYLGGPGAGQAAKVINNLILGVCITVNCEATLIAQRYGLDVHKLYEIVGKSTGDNWAFRNWNPAPGVNAPSPAPASPASRGYKPGFKTSLLAKDLGLAVEAGKAVGLQMAAAEVAHTLFAEHAKAGGADLDVTSLILGLAGSEHLDGLVGATRGEK